MDEIGGITGMKCRAILTVSTKLRVLHLNHLTYEIIRYSLSQCIQNDTFEANLPTICFFVMSIYIKN